VTVVCFDKEGLVCDGDKLDAVREMVVKAGKLVKSIVIPEFADSTFIAKGCIKQL
jgi:hypothetical protein